MIVTADRHRKRLTIRGAADSNTGLHSVIAGMGRGVNERDPEVTA